MTHERALDLGFLLGPPADPRDRALFEEAQHRFTTTKGLSYPEAAALLQPGLPALFRSRDGRPSVFASILSFVLEAPVEVDTPFLSFGYVRRFFVANIQLRPGDVRGPAEAIERLFADPASGSAIAASLGLVLKLDWVHCSRNFGPVEDDDSLREVETKVAP